MAERQTSSPEFLQPGYQLDFEKFDLRTEPADWDAPFGYFPDLITTFIDSVAALGHVTRIVVGDQITIPEGLKGVEHIDEIANALARRFDPLYNRIKYEIHKKDRNNKAFWASVEAGGAAVGAVIGHVETLFGDLEWIAPEVAVIDRVLVNGVAAIDGGDRAHDEKRRIADKWEEHLVKQIQDAGNKAGLNSDQVEQLRIQAWKYMTERYKAYADRFNDNPDMLRQAIHAGLKLHESAQARTRPIIGFLANAAYVKDRKHAVAYFPEYGKRYTSLAQLEQEANEARLVHMGLVLGDRVQGFFRRR